MKPDFIAIPIGLLLVPMVLLAEQTLPELSKRVPYLEQRLHSTRWEVRYYLLGNLAGRDSETKRVIEILVRDQHKGVANQALVRYVNNFVNIDKGIFRSELYVPEQFPVTDLPEKAPEKALVDYCLGRGKIEPKGGFRHDDMRPALPVLNPTKSDDPRMYETLTIVGILGNPEDAKALYPFLESTNDYVALGAAKALIRLGDRTKGVEALSRLTERNPSKHLFYVTQALYALKEIGQPELRTMTLRVLSTVDRIEGIQPNWLAEFLLLAAQVTDNDVWRAKEPHNKPDAGDGK